MNPLEPVSTRSSSHQALAPRLIQVLAYYGTTNLGDAIQTIALSRLLDATLVGVFRHTAAAHCLPDVPFVVNGWLGDAAPMQVKRCCFAGVFAGNRLQEQLKWFAASPFPIGARDPVMLQLCKSQGLAAELIGCATLTFARYDGPRKGRYSVDAFQPGTEFVSNVIEANLPWELQWKLAVQRLDLLRTAEVVYTSRLHIALPCLAFGTPVVFTVLSARAAAQRERLSLLHELRFTFGKPCVIDAREMASRYISFVSRNMNQTITPAMPRFPMLLRSIASTDNSIP